MSHNASDTEPAKLLAIFVVDTSDRKMRNEQRMPHTLRMRAVRFEVDCG